MQWLNQSDKRQLQLQDRTQSTGDPSRNFAFCLHQRKGLKFRRKNQNGCSSG